MLPPIHFVASVYQGTYSHSSALESRIHQGSRCRQSIAWIYARPHGPATEVVIWVQEQMF